MPHEKYLPLYQGPDCANECEEKGGFDYSTILDQLEREGNEDY